MHIATYIYIFYINFTKCCVSYDTQYDTIHETKRIKIRFTFFKTYGLEDSQ